VANGITTVHLAYVRENTGHALIAARKWIPAEHIDHPVKSLVMGLPEDLVFRTKGQLAFHLLTEVLPGGVGLDFVCGDEVYGSCTQLRALVETRGQGYAAGPVELSPHPCTWGQAHRQAGRYPAAGRHPPLGGPLRRERVEGQPLVPVGVARHRLTPPPPAHPPPHHHRRAGLSLLLCARRAGAVTVPGDPRRRAALAGGRRLRVRQGLLRAGPIPGPAYTAITRHTVLGHGRSTHHEQAGGGGVSERALGVLARMLNATSTGVSP
jgi:hypothetical protein